MKGEISILFNEPKFGPLSLICTFFGVFELTSTIIKICKPFYEAAFHSLTLKECKSKLSFFYFEDENDKLEKTHPCQDLLLRLYELLKEKPLENDSLKKIFVNSFKKGFYKIVVKCIEKGIVNFKITLTHIRDLMKDENFNKIGREKVLRCILSKKSKVEFIDISICFYEIRVYICSTKNLELILLLFNHKHFDYSDVSAVLKWFYKNNKIEMIKKILKGKKDIDISFENNFLLMSSVKANQKEFVEFLLNNSNLSKCNCSMALVVAVVSKNIEIVKVLLQEKYEDFIDPGFQQSLCLRKSMDLGLSDITSLLVKDGRVKLSDIYKLFKI